MATATVVRSDAPLAHSIAFAVPNQQALDVLAKHAPLLELGAGTGYWASLLRGAGVDVLAYDRDVPSAARLRPHTFSNSEPVL